MEYFNIFGFIFICVIMIPNIIYAAKCKNKIANNWNNKFIEVMEQIGRYGFIIFMIINIPYTWFGWWSDEGFDVILILLYCLLWIIYFNKNTLFRVLSLSIIPSIIFLFSGIMSRSILLIISSIIFSISHVTISYMNYKKSTC